MKQVITILFLLLYMVGVRAQENKLTIDNKNVKSGETFSMDVNLSNSADVVAVQFTMKVAEGITLDPATAKLTERANGHTITMREVSKGTYKVVVMSMSNSSITGTSGALMSVDATVSNDLGNGDELPIELSSVIITGRNAQNVCTSATHTANMTIFDKPSLTLTASKSDIKEGETFQLKVVTSKVLSVPLTVNLVCDKPTRFTLPASIVIPANATSATVDVEAVDNSEIDAYESVSFRAKADDYEEGECIVMLEDNDMPTLTLSLSPETVSEAAGGSAVFGIIKRTDNLDKRVTIKLSDDSNGLLTYESTTIILDKNKSEVQFSIGVLDNNIIDGNREVNITAEVYASSCNCTVQTDNKGKMTAKLTVLDNDGPSLTIKSEEPIMAEGTENNMFVISHNIQSDKDITVYVSSDKDDMLEYVHEQVIPAGQSMVKFPVKVKTNGVQNDDVLTTFKAEASQFCLGTCWIMITDKTLPDAIVSLSADKKEVNAEGTVALRVVVKNKGRAYLTSSTPVVVKFSGSKTSVKLDMGKGVSVGDSAVIEYNYALPAAVTGVHTFEAIVNPSEKIEEIIYTNNSSEKVTFSILVPYSLTAAVDKKTYKQNDSILVTGVATGDLGKNVDVEVYFINGGVRQSISARTDADGKYSVKWKPLSKLTGHFSVGACYPGSNETTEMDAFDVYGLKVEGNGDWLNLKLAEIYEGKITVVNTGNIAQTGLKVSSAGVSENCIFSYNIPDRVEAGASVDIQYTISCHDVSDGDDYQKMPIEITSNEGACFTYPIYYNVSPSEAALKVDCNDIKTTMTLGSPREYPVTIKNIGLGETGTITLSLPAMVQTVTPNQIASLAHGDSTTVMLRFNPTEDMKLNVDVTGTIGVNCKNGDGVAINFCLTPVSDTKGKLRIDVVDDYTYYTEKAPHVSQAKVTVRKPSTGEIVAEGETDEAGNFRVEIPEGYYKITVDAEKHDNYENYILVSPGQEKTEEVYISNHSVTYSWKVEETEIPDVYETELITTFDTRVPKPVVVITLPKEMPKLNSIVPVTVTNKGYINVLDVDIALASNRDYSFEYLNGTSVDTLGAQQSHVFYARMVEDKAHKVASAKAGGEFVPKTTDGEENIKTVCDKLGARSTYRPQCDRYVKKEVARASKGTGPDKCVSNTEDIKKKLDEDLGGMKDKNGHRDINGGAGYGGFGSTKLACNDSGDGSDPIDRDELPDEEPEYMPCDSHDEPKLVYKLVPVTGKRYIMDGVVADGTSKVKLVLDPKNSRIPKDECDNIKEVEWSLSHEIGKISGNSLREAIYTAPEGLTTEFGKSETVEATVQYVQIFDSNAQQHRKSSPVKIEIIRTPVLMVHGLFDDADDWLDFEKSLSPEAYDNLYYVKDINYRLDYKKTKTHGLDKNYPLVGKGVNKVISRAMNKGYVCSKVDVLGFGQGGLLARLYVQKGKGKNNVHKIITMNTPHSGTEWADAVKGHNILIGNIMRAFFLNTNIDGLYDLGVESDAIRDMNTYTNNNTKSTIPVHALASQNGVTSWLGHDGLGAFLGFVGDQAMKGGPIGVLIGIAAKYMSHFFADDWSQVGIGDGYVSTESQIGGCSAYDLRDFAIGHKEEPGWAKNNSKLKNMLLANANSSSFSHTWFNPRERTFDHSLWLLKVLAGEAKGKAMGKAVGWAAPKLADGLQKVSRRLKNIDTEKIVEAEKFVYEKAMDVKGFVESTGKYRTSKTSKAKSLTGEGTEEGEDSYIFFDLNIPEGYSDPFTFVSYGDEKFYCMEGESVDFIVPSTFTGEVKINVIMQHEDGNLYYQDYLYEITEPTATPLSLTCEEATLNVGETENPRVYCTWSDGSVTRVVPEEMNILNEKVARYEDKNFVAARQGSTGFTAKYRGLSCSGRIRVFASDSFVNKDENSNSVCSTISLSFKQNNVMTRQAFRGTFSVTNGSEDCAMTDVKLNLEVRDKEGKLATSREFQIDVESMKGFEGDKDLTAGWTLNGGGVGESTILFIPTRYAAQTEPEDYSFGGSFSYTDPYTGMTVKYDLDPVTLTVKPSPVLNMTYFMQRDVIGDDPLTENVVEPSEDAEFALLINNVGYGDAKNVTMTTKQPEIINNEKGLMINFDLVSSRLNGGEKNLALGGDIATDFGNIPANKTAYAQWQIRSSLLGHFVKYDVNATHVTSHDNPDLSLLGDVSIHEMIRSLEVGDGVGFLTNDVADSDDTPDMLYLSDGDVKDVVKTSAVSMKQITGSEYELTVNPLEYGWSYGKVKNKADENYIISKVVRKSDNKEMPVRNFWTTDRTLRDGRDPVYENMLHFADEILSPQETYVLTFVPKPDPNMVIVEYPLGNGWNWIAFGMKNESLKYVNKVLENGSWDSEDEVKDDDKSLAYSVSRKKWFGTLADDGFRNDVMYKMYSKNNQLLRVNGLLMTESEPITIEKGWNYIPYQPQQDATLSVALSDYEAAEGDVVKSISEMAVYDKDNGWVGELTTMKRGMGYMLKRQGDATVLKYADNLFAMAQKQEGGAREAKSSLFADNMCVIAQVNGIDNLSAEDTLVAIVQGEERGRCAAKGINNLAYITIGGELNDEVTFAMQRDGNTIAVAETRIGYDNDAVSGSLYMPTEINFVKQSGDYKAVNVWPKVVKDYVNVAIYGKGRDFSVSIYDTAGQIVRKVQHDVNDDVTSISIDCSSLSRDVYFVRVYDGNATLVTEKIIKK